MLLPMGGGGTVMRFLVRKKFHLTAWTLAFAVLGSVIGPGDALAQRSKPTCKTAEVQKRIETLRKRIEIYDKREGDAQVEIFDAEVEIYNDEQAVKKDESDVAKSVDEAKKRSLEDYRKELQKIRDYTDLKGKPVSDKEVEDFKQRAIDRAGTSRAELREKLDAAKEKLRQAQGKLRRAQHGLRDTRKELEELEKLPDCEKTQTMVVPSSGCPSGCLAGLPSGMTLEATAFAGGVSATSFGSDFDTSLFGGRFAAAFQAPRGIRVQLDAQGEATNDYCPTCGSRAYVAGAGHVDWSPTANVELGGFGGAQDARPTFNAPTSTNGFGGFEGRIFLAHAVLGGDIGYFDVASGPGTLTKAWFTEGRAKFELAPVFSNWRFGGPTLELGAGYASGHAGALPNNAASSTHWHAMLAVPIPDTPVQAFVKYMGYANRVDTLGTVWMEHAMVGGVQVNLGCACDKPLESMTPLPFVLRTVTTF